MRPPVPHVEGMDAVVGVRRAVQVDVPRVGRVVLLELRLDRRRVGGLGQHLLEEVDVGRVVHLGELVGHRVEDDHRAARPHQRLVPVHVEEVAEPQAVHEDRVHDRVHVVGPEVGQAHDHDVALPVHLDELLLVQRGEGALVHGLGLAGVARRSRRSATGPRQDLVPGRRRREVVRLLRGQVGALLDAATIPTRACSEAERVGERLVVQRRLDREDPRAVAFTTSPIRLHESWMALFPGAGP